MTLGGGFAFMYMILYPFLSAISIDKAGKKYLSRNMNIPSNYAVVNLHSEMADGVSSGPNNIDVQDLPTQLNQKSNPLALNFHQIQYLEDMGMLEEYLEEYSSN